MQIDHIFIFSNNNGKEADELLEFGFVEGSSRVHQGQGTTNRKFYFENFFLEILWVSDLQEIKSDLISPTKLWQRAEFKENNFSPFGLCLVNTKDTDILFSENAVNAVKYQPQYFPVGMEIEILPNVHLPHLPWTFRLPLSLIKGGKKPSEEPINHTNSIENLTEVIFGIPYFDNIENDYLACFRDEPSIKFTKNKVMHIYTLTLTFDNQKQGKTKVFSALPLIIKY